MGRLPFDLEIEDISALADIINEKELGEIRLEDDDIGAKIVIKGRPVPPPPPAMTVPMAAQTIPAAALPAAAMSAMAAPDTSVSPAEKKIDGNVVKAPVVGTYYSSPSPDKPSFVKRGQTVKKGDIIMIIESMKIMNEIPSPYDGVVKEILAENGQAVEYDEPIMIIG